MKPHADRLKMVWVAGSLLAFSFMGCSRGISPATAAALNTAIAVGVSGARRVQGDCFTWCDQGTQCNPTTGLCEPIACGGECKPGEYCDASGPVPKCVPSIMNDLNLRQRSQDPYEIQDPANPLEVPPPLE